MAEPPTVVTPRRMTRTDWDDYKDLIIRWYVREKKSAKEVIEELRKPHNFIVKLYELKERLSSWNLRKNLSPAEQAFVTSNLGRASPINAPIQYGLMGEAVSQRRIQRLRYRRWEPVAPMSRLDPALDTQGRYLLGRMSAFSESVAGHMSVLPSTDLTVSKFKPPELNELYKWEPWPNQPHELPWIRFKKDSPLLDSIHSFLFTGSSARRCALGSSFPQYFNPSQSDMLRSSAQTLATTFNAYMPESRKGENEDMANSVIKSWPELDSDLLKLVIFQLSNNFIETANYRNIIHLSNQLGIGNQAVIRALFRVASKDLTIAAVLDKLFIAAYKTLSADLLSIMIEENEFIIDGEREIVLRLPVDDALKSAIYACDLKATMAILGCSRVCVEKVVHSDGSMLIELCARETNHHFANSAVTLLISRGASIQKCGDSGFFPVWLALQTGNTALALHLIESGARASQKEDSTMFNSVLTSSKIWRHPFASRFRTNLFVFRTIYTAAVCNCCCPDLLPRGRYLDPHRKLKAAELEQHRQRAEQAALQNYAFLWDQLAATASRRSPTAGSELAVPDYGDMLILGAFYGYPNLIQMILKEPHDLNQANRRGMWPLLAAVLGGHTGTCQRLLELGANPNFVPSCSSHSSSGDAASEANQIPGVLHQASFLGLPAIVELLIQFGAVVNHSCDVTTCKRQFYPEHPEADFNSYYYRSTPWELGVHGDECWWCNGTKHLRPHRPDCITYLNTRAISPLTVALATVCSLPWFRAASKLEYLQVARILLQDGAAVVGPMELCFAFRYHDHGILSDIFPNLQDDMFIGSTVDGFVPIDPPSRHQEGLEFNLLEAEHLPLAVMTGSMKVVRWVLQVMDVQKDHRHFSSALQNAIKGKFSEIETTLRRRIIHFSREQLPREWLSDAFGAYSKDELLIALESTPNMQALSKEHSSRGRSLLEESVLNNDSSVAEIALEIFPRFYDSGALIASFCRSLASDEVSSKSNFAEILRRRNIAPQEQLDPVIENGVMALAISFDKTDLLDMLLDRTWPEEAAVIPGSGHWDCAPDTTGIPGTHSSLTLELPFGIANPEMRLRESVSKTWIQWHNKDRWTVSPMLMAAKSKRKDIIQRLIEKGYRPDGPSLATAILGGLQIPNFHQFWSMRRSAYTDSVVDMRFNETLYAAIFAKRVEIVQILTANESTNHGYFLFHPCSKILDVFKVSKFIQGSYLTLLQMAVEIDSPDDIIHHLVRNGADANAPAHVFGKTVLQSAAAQGKIGLARYFMKLGVDLNAPRGLIRGKTCLEAAAREGRLDMVQFLLNEGAETLGKGRVQFLRAISLAYMDGHAAVVKLLLRHRLLDRCDEVLILEDTYHWFPPHSLVQDHLANPSISLPPGNSTTKRFFDGEPFFDGEQPFTHPDEMSREERLNARAQCFKEHLRPMLDAELDLLSDEECDIPMSEREFLLATILTRPEEVKKRFLSLSCLQDSYSEIHEAEDISDLFLVSSSVALLRLSLRQTSISSVIGHGTAKSSQFLNQDSYPDESFNEESQLLANSQGEQAWMEDISDFTEEAGPSIPFHTRFKEFRDLVDFHEEMQEDLWG